MPEPTYDFCTGSVFYEIELMLSSESGRPKHTDLNEQGGWLVLAIKQALNSVPVIGAAYGKIRYWGTTYDPAGQPISETEVGPYQQPYIEERVVELRRLVSDLARLLGDLERSGASLPADIHELVEWAEGARDLRDVTNDDIRGPLWPMGFDADVDEG